MVARPHYYDLYHNSATFFAVPYVNRPPLRSHRLQPRLLRRRNATAARTYLQNARAGMTRCVPLTSSAAGSAKRAGGNDTNDPCGTYGVVEQSMQREPCGVRQDVR